MSGPAGGSWRVPVLAGGLALVLFSATSARDVLWSDSAKHMIQVAERDLLGFAFGRHPLHTLAGLAFSLLPVPLPRSQHLLSAAMGAVATALLARAGQRVASPAAAGLAALALALSHTFWLYSVINETYALFWALLAAMLLAALRHRETGSRASLAAFALLSGLAFSAHGLAALTVPALGLLALGRGPRRAGMAGWALALVMAAAGTALVWLPAPAGSPGALAPGLVASTGAEASHFLHPGRMPRELLRYPAYLAFQFPGPAALALLVGAARLWRRDRGLLLALAGAALPIVLFASGHMPQREFAMLGASYVLLVPLIAGGLEALGQALGRLPASRALVAAGALAVLAAPPLACAAAVALVRAHGLPVAIRELPFRDEVRYFLWPPKHADTGARLYLEEARRRIPPGATVLCDFNPCEVLRYGVVVEGSLRVALAPVVDDLVLAGTEIGPALAARIDAELDRGREVWLADRYEPYYAVSALSRRFRLEVEGPFLHVAGRR